MTYLLPCAGLAPCGRRLVRERHRAVFAVVDKQRLFSVGVPRCKYLSLVGVVDDEGILTLQPGEALSVARV